MKNIRRIPTILGLFLLLAGTAGGVILIKKIPVWFVGAQPEITPKQVKISNISENSFSVSWITDQEVSGFVQYGTGGDFSFTVTDDRDQLSGNQGKFLTHHVTVRNLKPATTYFFKINSGGRPFDNNGQPYQITTAPFLEGSAPANDIAYGVILNQDGSPAEGVIVYLSLANATLLSTLVKASGSWLIPLNLARSADLANWATYDREASIEEIFAQGGLKGIATAVAATKYDSPLPTITLGQNFDFRKPLPTPTSELSQTETSRQGFSVETQITPTPAGELAIVNPSPGETINTSKPEFFGTGPAGQVLTVVVNSPEILRGRVTIDEDGNWSWTPPTGFPLGEHTFTISLTDGRKISRSFTVLAAGTSDLPSFTATPSATVTPSLTPTLTPTTPPRVSLPSTESGVPKPGNLTPTFLFSIMGLVLMSLGLLSSILFKKL